MKVAILGCGPTGLMAAHACHQLKVDATVFSKKRKSELVGSQYLHKPVAVNPYSGVNVKYVVLGTPEEYRQKVHGKWWDGHVAPEDFEPDHKAWNIRTAYDNLWTIYGRDVVGYTIPDPSMFSDTYRDDGAMFETVSRDLGLHEFDLVISTVPRDLWRISGEEFIYSEGWALGDAPERGIFVEDLLASSFGEVPLYQKPDGSYIPDNHIICDGTSQVPWTRLSRVFGYTTVEWPHHTPQPHPQAARVRKPLHYSPASQNPNPTADWLHVGRYGQFEKGVVVTDAFDQVIKKIRSM